MFVARFISHLALRHSLLLTNFIYTFVYIKSILDTKTVFAQRIHSVTKYACEFFEVEKFNMLFSVLLPITGVYCSHKKEERK